MNELINILGDKKRDFSRRFGKEIATVHYLEGGVETSVFLDKDDMVFTAVVNDKHFRDKDGEKVKAWAHERLKAITEVKWLPIIIVIHNQEKGVNSWHGWHKVEQHVVSVDISRWWVGKVINGGIRMAEWDVPEPKRLGNNRDAWDWPYVDNKRENPLDPATLPYNHGDKTFMPYTEEMWASLERLCAGIDKLGSQLSTLISSPGGQKQLMEVGAKLTKLLTYENPTSKG